MKIHLNANMIGPSEIEAVVEVLRSGAFTMGEKCHRFEEAFAEYLGVRNAVFVNSGSSANLLAAFALANPQVPLSQGKKRLCPGDEVIVPAVTWSTTVWPIVQAGGVPVIVDSDPQTLQMKPDQVEGAITPKTRAICPVHVLGNAVAMAPFIELARRHHLWLIEDTCESLGTLHGGRYAGTFGDIGTFSFFFSHHITTIEGGMITTADVLTQAHDADLRERVTFVGWLQLPGRYALWRKNLSILRVHARARDVNQMCHVIFQRGQRNVEPHRQVVGQESNGVGDIRLNAADFGREMYDQIRFDALDVTKNIIPRR